MEYPDRVRDLFSETKKIEEEMGRVRNEKWGPRVIDIDILLFGDLILDEEDLKIPHPELHKRRFAMIPLLEIDKEILHPLFRKRLRDFLRGIDRSQKVKFIGKITLPDLEIGANPCTERKLK